MVELNKVNNAVNLDSKSPNTQSAAQNSPAKFQGTNISNAVPPSESPLLEKTGKSAASANNRAMTGNGYTIGGKANADNNPSLSDQQLFDAATNGNNNDQVTAKLAQNFGDSKAVGQTRQAHKEINESQPTNDQLLPQSRFDQIANKLFGR